MDKESVQATSPKAYDQVLEYLKTLIKNKDISYGGKIPSERELMETLGISRNSVREALRILEHTGVLESRHGKGNFLVNRMGESLSSVFSMLVLMEESNYREVNQLRSVLEKQAYVQACALISEEGKEKAGAIINRMENGDLEERIRSDHELHHLVFEYSQNRLLILLTNALSEIIRSEGEVVLRHPLIRKNGSHFIRILPFVLLREIFRKGFWHWKNIMNGLNVTSKCDRIQKEIYDCAKVKW